MIYMTHPQHGMMHVYVEAEAQANEKNGWKRVVVEATPAPMADELIPPVAFKRGPGRPRKDE